MVDTSTEAVTKLLDGVTPGPWSAESGHVQQNGQLYWQVTDKNHAIMQNQFCWCQGDHAANARFIAAARDLVPALLAERDALWDEVDRINAQPAQSGSQFVTQLHQEHFDAFAKAVERVECQPVDHITVQDAALVEHVAFSLWKAEAERAAPNVARNRTPEMFLGELESTRAKWLSLADAALRAITDGK